MADYLLTAAVVVLLAAAVFFLRQAVCASEALKTERGKNRHLQQQIAGYRTDLARLSAYNGRLIADNAGLTDALDAINGEPTLTEAVYADLAELDITYPGDPR